MQRQLRILDSEFLILGFTLLSTLTALLSAQSGRSVLNGVYTDDQARRGEAVSKSKCQACHGERLSGDMGPPLAGADFIANWSGKPASELFDKIRTTMPQGQEGTLSPKETADLLAYLFQLNKFPVGSDELGADASALGQIQIQPGK